MYGHPLISFDACAGTWRGSSGARGGVLLVWGGQEWTDLQDLDSHVSALPCCSVLATQQGSRGHRPAPPAQERHCSVKMATNGSTDSFLKDMLVASVLVSCCGTWDRKI